MEKQTERDEMPENTMTDAREAAAPSAADAACAEAAEGAHSGIGEAIESAPSQPCAAAPCGDPEGGAEAADAAEGACEEQHAEGASEEPIVEDAAGADPEAAEASEADETAEATEASETEEAAEAAEPVSAAAEAAPAEAPDAEQPEPDSRENSKVRVRSIIGGILLGLACLILIPLLCINVTLIIKSYMDEENMPDVFGIAPIAVAAETEDGSPNDFMQGEEEGCYDPGSLILIRTFDKSITTAEAAAGDAERQSIEVGDVVAFRWTTEGGATKFSVYRVVGITRDEETDAITSVSVRADNPIEGEDAHVPVSIEDVCGIYMDNFAHLGEFALFMTEGYGVLIIVGIPLALYIIIDIIRITIHNRKVRDLENEEMRDKDEEIARLRALVEQRAAAPAAPVFAEEAPDGEPSEGEALPEEIPEEVPEEVPLGEPAEVFAEGEELHDEPLPELVDETVELTDEEAGTAEGAAELIDEAAELADEEADAANKAQNGEKGEEI